MGTIESLTMFLYYSSMDWGEKGIPIRTGLLEEKKK